MINQSQFFLVHELPFHNGTIAKKPIVFGNYSVFRTFNPCLINKLRVLCIHGKLGDSEIDIENTYILFFFFFNYPYIKITRTSADDESADEYLHFQ